MAIAGLPQLKILSHEIVPFTSQLLRLVRIWHSQQHLNLAQNVSNWHLLGRCLHFRFAHHLLDIRDFASSLACSPDFQGCSRTRKLINCFPTSPLFSLLRIGYIRRVGYFAAPHWLLPTLHLLCLIKRTFSRAKFSMYSWISTLH